jgi:hypothetical protein
MNHLKRFFPLREKPFIILRQDFSRVGLRILFVEKPGFWAEMPFLSFDFTLRVNAKYQKNCILSVPSRATGTIFVSVALNRSFQRRRV